LRKLLLTPLVLLPPLLTAWLVSSLATWLGGPRWVAFVAMVLVFPVLPLLWQTRATQKTLAGLVLRTLFVSAVFLGGLLWLWPTESFLALSRRGDWFLDGTSASDATHVKVREAAKALEGLYRLALHDPYAEHLQPAPQLTEAPKPAVVAVVTEAPQPPKADAVRRGFDSPPKPVAPSPTASPKLLCATTEDGASICVEAEEPPTPQPQAQVHVPKPNAEPPPQHTKIDLGKVDLTQLQRSGEPGEASPQPVKLAWPLPDVVHPAIAKLTASDETDIASTASRLAALSAPGADRIKALHDYVAVRVAYDTVAFFGGTFPDQSAGAVFSRRTAVCAGYANLLAALGKAAGERIEVVSGVADGYGGWMPHAWNAASVDGNWVLMDSTWNAGGVRNKSFVAKYETEYLFMPPERFVLSHLPNDARWQLLANPVSLASLPNTPKQYSSGFLAKVAIEKPERSPSETSSSAVDVQISNPDRRDVYVYAGKGEDNAPCRKQSHTAFTCELPTAGDWRITAALFDAAGPQVLSLAMIHRR
jgi:transglutaminase-like putative cysteine protease